MAITGKGWVRDYDVAPGWLENLNGVGWRYAPIPPRWHRCAPQTRGLWDIERCACGAIRENKGSGRWFGRNSRRRHGREESA